MGYFYHLYAIEKDRIEELRNVKNDDELIAFCKKYNYPFEKCGDEPIYVGLYDIAHHEVYDFGEACNEILDASEEYDKLFYSDEMNEKFVDYNARLVDKDFILKTIEAYKNNVKRSLEDDLEDNSNNPWVAHFLREQRLIAGIEDKLNYIWVGKYGPADIDLDSVNVTTSWRYEYAFFNLVAQYKAFDDEKYALFFMGW